MSTLCLIPRDNLTRSHYVRLGIPKRLVRRSTVIDSQGRRFIDSSQLAEISGRVYVEVINQLSRSGILPKLELSAVCDRLKQLGLIKGGGIYWKAGIENSNKMVRQEMALSCHALVEKLAKNSSVWGLTIDDFQLLKLPKIDTTLLGLYHYYAHHPDRSKMPVIEFMLERLGYDRLESLTLAEQLLAIKCKRRVEWSNVPLATQRYLVERLVEDGNVWGLVQDDFTTNLPEIGSTLSGLFTFYDRHPDRGKRPVIEFMLERLGYDRFEYLTLAEQLTAMKRKGTIDWPSVPLATQRYLVERLVEDGNVWGLVQADFRTNLPEIGSTSIGLYNYYGRHPDRSKRPIIEFMLERLGYDRFESLTLAKQLTAMKRKGKIDWLSVPLATQRYLIERLAEDGNVWGLTCVDFRTKELPEIGANLQGYYQLFNSRQPNRAETPIIEYLLQSLGFGFPAFNGAGRLFASAKARTPSQSMYRQLTVTRAVIHAWRKIYPAEQLISINRVGYDRAYQSQTREVPIYQFDGSYINYFKLSYLDLICLALQHIPLDELEPAYRAEHLSEPNYLIPSMFLGYLKSSAESQKPAHVVGYYSEKKRDRELANYLKILEHQIVREASGEEEPFSPKWLETQKRGLRAIMSRLEKGEPLPLPLKYALGLQGRLDKLQPELSNEEGLTDLNPSQKTGARIILNENNPLVLIQGPAGTGKTKTIARAIERLVRKGKKVAYLTPTHKAAKVFMERIAKDEKEGYSSLPVLRLGVECDKFDDISKRYWVRDREVREDFKKKRRETNGFLFVGTIAGGVHFLTDEGAEGTRQDLFGEYVGGVRISRSPREYDVVIIDEASMASKPEVYAALALAKRGVIIGDHVQLEPFPVDKKIVAELELNEREAESIERSLLEELMFAYYPYVLLETNYRAINPAMIVLASRIFYDERIKVNQESDYFKISPEARARRYPADSLKLIDTSSIPYYNKSERKVGTSYANDYEADLAVKEAKKLTEQGFKLKEIGFITPYLAQAELIKQKLRVAFPEEASEKHLKDWVSTFDGFQGDQNKCMIISFVRSNDKQPPETGFVGNYHRVNVGITRAEERMVLIGDWSTLKKTGEGEEIIDSELTDTLAKHTRHIFEELEAQVAELEQERRAEIVRL